MVKLTGALSSLLPSPILVLGDFFLDTYTFGNIRRISPEAPVPVMEVLSHEARPGGAGNVALNLNILGAPVTALGRRGDDSHGLTLLETLASRGIHCQLLIEPDYKTPVKNRFVGGGQQLLRVDTETITPLPPSLEEKVIAHLHTFIPQTQMVALSDYGKGFLTPRILAAAIEIARTSRVPVIVDPKGADFTKYAGATILKPNLSEAYAAAKLPSSVPLEEVAAALFATTSIDNLLITRSEAGMTLFEASGQRTDFPVRSREVKDVTGAGDTVLAILALALANRLALAQAIPLANLAAGIAIERLGCAQVTLADLAQRLLDFDSDTKIFDEGHIFALAQVLKGKKYSLLVLEKGQELSLALFRAIRHLASHEALVLYVQDSHPDDEFLHFLSSLKEVDCIIVPTAGLQHLCNSIHPHFIYRFDGHRPILYPLAHDLLGCLLGDKVSK